MYAGRKSLLSWSCLKMIKILSSVSIFLVITKKSKYYLAVAHFLKAILLGNFTLYLADIIISRL